MSHIHDLWPTLFYLINICGICNGSSLYCTISILYNYFVSSILLCAYYLLQWWDLYRKQCQQWVPRSAWNQPRSLASAQQRTEPKYKVYDFVQNFTRERAHRLKRRIREVKRRYGHGLYIVYTYLETEPEVEEKDPWGEERIGTWLIAYTVPRDRTRGWREGSMWWREDRDMVLVYALPVDRTRGWREGSMWWREDGDMVLVYALPVDRTRGWREGSMWWREDRDMVYSVFLSCRQVQRLKIRIHEVKRG